MPRIPGKTADASEHLPYALSVRLTSAQRVFLQMVAEGNDVGVSSALRIVLDAVIAEHVDPQTRSVLEVVRSFESDPDWLAKHGDEP